MTEGLVQCILVLYLDSSTDVHRVVSIVAFHPLRIPFKKRVNACTKNAIKFLGNRKNWVRFENVLWTSSDTFITLCAGSITEIQFSCLGTNISPVEVCSQTRKKRMFEFCFWSMCGQLSSKLNFFFFLNNCACFFSEKANRPFFFCYFVYFVFVVFSTKEQFIFNDFSFSGRNQVHWSVFSIRFELLWCCLVRSRK